jgi:hypothetical protein
LRRPPGFWFDGAEDRSCFAIELDPLYVDVAVRRWQAFTGDSATLLADGRIFDAVAAERLLATKSAPVISVSPDQATPTATGRQPLAKRE